MYSTNSISIQASRGLLVCLALGLSAPAHSAAYWILEQGNAAYGRAGANIAGADDGSTLYLNPAWLAELQGFEVVVGANAIKDYRSFERADLTSPEDQTGLYIPDLTYERVDNLADYPRLSPNLFVTYALEPAAGHSLGFGVGVWGPPRADLEYDPEGAQRYGLVNSYNIQAHPAVGAAYGHRDSGVYIGAHFAAVTQIVDTTLKLFSSPNPLVCADYEDPGCDLRAHVYTRQDYIPVWALGLGWVSDFGLRLGLSYQTGFEVNATGEATFTLGPDLEDKASIIGNDVAVDFDMPWVLRAAVRYAPENSNWDIELAYTREQWSVQQTIDFDASGVGVDVIDAFNSAGVEDIESVGLIQLKPTWRDSESLRLGGSMDFFESMLITRLGVYYESGAQKRKMMDIGTFDPPKLGITTGVRYTPARNIEWLGDGSVYFDASVGYVEWMQTEVVSSEAELNNPTSDEPTYVIGNGVYDSMQIITMAAIGVRL